MNEGRMVRLVGIGANLAVLAGLIFVGVEVRNGRAAVEAQIADGIAEGFIEHNLATVTDSTVARIWVVGLEAPDRLSDMEAARFSAYFRASLNQYLRVYRLSNTGLVDPEFWEVLAGQVAWQLSTPGGHLFHDGNELPDGFLEAIEPFTGTATPPDQMLGRPVPLN